MNEVPHQWWPESSDLPEEFPSGARVRSVTCSPAITHNIYLEQPYNSPDGKRFALFRTLQGDPREPGDLLVYDIEKFKLARLERGVFGMGAGFAAMATSAWSGQVYVVKPGEKSSVLLRFNLETLEREELFDWTGMGAYGLQTVSPCGTWGLLNSRLDKSSFGVFRLDLKTGQRELIHESAHICNPHLQIRLVTGNRILIQENRGCIVDDGNNTIRGCDERGVGLYSIDQRGNDRRDFPVGPPFTPATTGHECWIGDTDRVLVTLTECIDDGTRRGNVVEVSHEEAKPRVVFDSPYVWNHVSASRCGNYLVADTYDEPGVPVLIAHIASGKSDVLCPSLAAGGGAQFCHAHPYLTADNKWVVFNTNRIGISQSAIASVPDEFLRGLSDQ